MADDTKIIHVEGGINTHEIFHPRNFPPVRYILSTKINIVKLYHSLAIAQAAPGCIHVMFHAYMQTLDQLDPSVDSRIEEQPGSNNPWFIIMLLVRSLRLMD